jgi:hypothetical protein
MTTDLNVHPPENPPEPVQPADWLGQTVHYTRYLDAEVGADGPHGEGATKVCCQAIVSELGGRDGNPAHADRLGLVVLVEPGVNEHCMLADGGSRYDGVQLPKCEPGPSGRPAGTWHFEGSCG